MSKRYEVKRFSSCYSLNWVDNKTNKELTEVEIQRIVNNQQQQIADLEAKLAESKENCFDLQQRLADKEEQCRECKHLNKKIELNIKNKLLIENEQFKQQLAEKEKKIKNLTLAHFESETNKPVLTTTQIINQDKISFAVKQLEKVKEFCDGMKWAMVHLTKENTQTIQTVLDEIDSQIKQLKEKKNENN